MPAAKVIHGPSLLSEQDVWLFRQGRHYRLQDHLGAHPFTLDGRHGTLFAAWAPNAAGVAVVGDFNDWDPGADPLAPRWDSSGIWEGFVPGAGTGARYKLLVQTGAGETLEKADPFALRSEGPPGNASIVALPEFDWRDDEWMAARLEADPYRAPMSVYEVHAGSWRRKPGGGMLSWLELADPLIAHVRDRGFTHVEFLPVMEHPFYGSWGYQVSGFFCPAARYGAPGDLAALVDRLHRAGIGVILDWTPAHFPDDAHGLARFDGTCLFEHSDPRQGLHPDWHTRIFNYGRNEVRSFLVSSALFWLDRFHADGLRCDAVASMLYLDYSRKPGEWLPNRLGGNENLEAVEFLRELNRAVGALAPGAFTVAEESTAWPGVTRPVHEGGLGFGFKWNLGWMHDTLDCLARDPIHRKHHHDRLCLPLVYAWSENFILPLSHDEVVHGKRSLLEKLPGDDWRQFANLRLLLGWQWLMPGKKLLFQGGEFGARREWDHDRGLDWHELESDFHRGVLQWVTDLNRLYRDEPALWNDADPAGFEWVDCADKDAGVVSFLRKSPSSPSNPRTLEPSNPLLLAVVNLTPVPRPGYRVGVPVAGAWRELLNSDAHEYRGSGQGNLGRVESEPKEFHGRPHSLALNLPPLGILVLAPEPETAKTPRGAAPASRPPEPGPRHSNRG